MIGYDLQDESGLYELLVKGSLVQRFAYRVLSSGKLSPVACILAVFYYYR